MVCCSFIGTIIVVLSALVSLALLIASNVGTIGEQAAKSSIFLMELSMSGLDVSKLYPGGADVKPSELGFADAYIFGMYGYCRGSQGTTEVVDKVWENIHFTSSSCTQSSITYEFDPVSFIVDEVNNHNTVGINITAADVTLPGSLNKYIKTAEHISQVIYICSIIAICLTIVAILCELLCWCFGSMVIVLFFQTLAFFAAIISSGCATGAFKYIETEFNKNGSTFGIHAKLSRNYLVLTWVGTGVSLLTVFLVMIGRCCFAPRPAPAPTYDRVL
ncbi:hypothetical protein PICMEDRAFT_11488 [Pichia membranifaciens NRRL Y-2026]|uniref:Actin cortical patch SUR7/pH-response regulator pali n=1 Tax=Pichia membranifaciens NRRL Y-2026 TaxID=763406 RepID=A0A1E3NK24_9ASCO|nr:hypothetical protein PICMEDRAFT_11488 [Pichia membranifaciens NRRL Y-2026]ODQ46494.1 hypothetical protein PICMEDRAFT_11488 [Pichia membranifaciens NRRL Y-2026]